MSLNRAEVERMLATVRPRDDLGGYMHMLTGEELTDLCRVWLAVDAAPVADLYGECAEYGGGDFYHVAPDDRDALRAIHGQRVRIVPEPQA